MKTFMKLVFFCGAIYVAARIIGPVFKGRGEKTDDDTDEETPDAASDTPASTHKTREDMPAFRKDHLG